MSYRGWSLFFGTPELKLPGENTIKLEKEIIDENMQSKVIALTLAVSNKLVEPELLDEIWKEVAMLNIFKYAEEKGEEKGKKKGIEIGRSLMRLSRILIPW